MQKKSLLIVILLLATALLAQTHTYPSTDSNATITGQWTFTMPTTFLQLTGSTSPLAAAPACSASGTYWLAPIGGTVNAWQFCGNGILYNLSSGGGGFTAGGDLSGSSIDQVVVGIQGNHIGSLAVGCLQWTGSAVIWGSCGSSFITSLTTTGTSGPATVSSGVLNIPQYSGGSSFNPASPGPIGGTTPSTVNATAVTAQSVNVVYNPLLAPGSTIDAQIAYVETNFCATDSIPCNIVIPLTSSPLSFSSAIPIGNDTHVSCTPSGWSLEEQGGAVAPQLNYTGSGIAVNMVGNQDSFEGCTMQLSSTATEGVHADGAAIFIKRIYMMGGGSSTLLLHATSAENLHYDDSTDYAFNGVAVSLDHTNNIYINNDELYAASGSTTAKCLVVDTQANGTILNNNVCGGSGMVVQNTGAGGAGNAPNYIFANYMNLDCPVAADSLLFASSLGTWEVGATFTNSWFAGAGTNCGSSVITPSAAGVHISGGKSIFIGGGSKIRANAGDGVLIDNSNVAVVHITNSLVDSNNWNPGGSGNNPLYSGVRITAGGQNIEIDGNHFGNIEIKGHQGWGAYTTAIAIPGLEIVNNICDSNVTGCINDQNVSVTQDQNFGNLLGQSAPDTENPNSHLTGNLMVTSHYSDLGPTLDPEYGGYNNFLEGVTGNLEFNGTNWITQTDSTNNGAFALLGTHDGSFGIYSVPTSSPSTGQTVTPTGLASDAVMTVSNAGLFSFAHNVSLPGLTVSGLTGGGAASCTYVDNSGVLHSHAGADCGSGGGSTAFSALTGSTNTTAAMVVGTGASLATSGTGTIAATSAPYSGLTGTVPTWNQNTTGSSAVSYLHEFPATASTGGTTANLLVVYDGTTGNVTTAPINVLGAVGIASATATSGNPLYVIDAGITSCVADNTITVGDLLGVGVTTAGRCHDLGVVQGNAVLSNVQIVGKAVTSASTGGTFSVQTVGAGHFGTLVTAASVNTSVCSNNGCSQTAAAIAGQGALATENNPTTAQVASAGTLSNNTTGTATNATEIGGITVTGTPSVGYVPTATSGTAATWQAASSGTGSSTNGQLLINSSSAVAGVTLGNSFFNSSGTLENITMDQFSPDPSSSYTSLQWIFVPPGVASQGFMVTQPFTYPILTSAGAYSGTAATSYCALGVAPTAAWTATFYDIPNTTHNCSDTTGLTAIGSVTISTANIATFSFTSAYTVASGHCRGWRAQSSVDTTAAQFQCSLVVVK